MPSVAATEALFAQETGEVFLQLVEITGAGLPEPLRFAHNTQPIVSQGRRFDPAKFSFSIPTGKVGGSAKAELSISNVDRRPVEAVRSISTPLVLVGWVIRATAPDAIESGPFAFTLRRVSWNAKTLRGELYDDIDGCIAIPKIRYNPADFPALY